ncbi:hypothetical protein [Deinococcus hohokamensis]|uniref:Uncharacterized protein n=1 Tax=Deinococcus hohokamensis TaxID=309883 RepID=A0ABV9I7Z2_9DEIO
MTIDAETVICRWVPGTLDSVRVTGLSDEEVLSIHEVTRRFGREAADALYLRGRYTGLHASAGPGLQSGD